MISVTIAGSKTALRTRSPFPPPERLVIVLSDCWTGPIAHCARLRVRSADAYGRRNQRTDGSGSRKSGSGGGQFDRGDCGGAVVARRYRDEMGSAWGSSFGRMPQCGHESAAGADFRRKYWLEVFRALGSAGDWSRPMGTRAGGIVFCKSF